MAVTKFDAKAKLYLNTEERDFSLTNSYQRDIIYPSEYDNKNRRGQNWHVLDIDMESIFGQFKIDKRNLFEVKVENPYSEAFVSYRRFVPEKRMLFLADLYYYLYKEIDFLFKIFDQDGNELPLNSHIKLIKEDVEYSSFSFSLSEYFYSEKYLDKDRQKSFTGKNPTISTFNAFKVAHDEYNPEEYWDSNIRKIIFRLIDDQTNSLPKNVKKIKLFVNQKTMSQGLTFFEYEFSNDNRIDSFKIMNHRRFIPILLYDDKDNLIENVDLEYRKLYGPYEDVGDRSYDFTYENKDNYNFECGAYNNIVQIDILDRLLTLEICKSIGFVLAVDNEIPYSSLKYQDGINKGKIEKVENVEKLEKYLYFGTEEIESSITCNDSTQKIYVHGLTQLNEENPSVEIRKDKQFNVNILPISLYTYEKNIQLTDINEITSFTTIEFENMSTTLIVPKSKMVDDETHEPMLCVNQKLISIKDVNGNPVSFNESMTSWKVNNITIQLNEVPSSNILTFEFKTYRNVIDKNEFAGDLKEKDFHPNVYLIKNGIELSSNYIYVHKDLSSYMYFEKELEENANYKIQMIDFQRIYKFNVHTLNYFDKNMTTTLSSYASDDEFEDILNNISFTISEKSKDDESFRLTNGAYINGKYKNSNGDYYIDSLDSAVPNMSVSFGKIREDWDYQVKAASIYKKNDFMTKIDIFNEISHVDRSLESNFKYSGKSPFVHYYGYIVDALGNKILETPGMINHGTVPNAWLSIDYDKTPETDLMRTSTKKTAYENNGSYDYRSNPIKVNTNALNVTDVTYPLTSTFAPYWIMKNNDIPIQIKLKNTDAVLSADLQYESSQNPIYILSALDYENIPIYAKYDDLLNSWEYDSFKNASSLYLATYERNISKSELKYNYDFFFADFITGGKEKLYPGEYSVSLFAGENLIKDGIFEKSLIKSEEVIGNTHNQLIEWPNVNINGRIVDTFGNTVHRAGTLVRLTNNDTNEVFEFKYSCAYPLEEGLIGVGAFSKDRKDIKQWSDDEKQEVTLAFHNEYTDYKYQRNYWLNAWDEHFRFMYSGCDCRNMYYVENGPYVTYYNGAQYFEMRDASKPVRVLNCDSLKSSPAISSGHYKLDLISSEGELISTYFDDLLVSKERQAELYDVELELPYCSVTGSIHTENGDLCYGNDWTVKLTCIDDPDKTRTMTLWSRDPASSNSVSGFVFNGLGVLRDYEGTSKIHKLWGLVGGSVSFYDYDDNMTNKLSVQTSGYLKDYAEHGVLPGEYSLTVEYKGNTLYEHPTTVIVSKENERAGLLNFDLIVPNVFTSVAGQIINDQFPEVINQKYGNRVELNEEDYDDDITDDFTDPNRSILSNSTSNSISFNRISNLGKFAVSLSATHADGNEFPDNAKIIEIPISDILDSEKDSVFNASGTVHPTKSLVDVSKAKKDSMNIANLEVHVPYWYTYWGKIFTYTDEHCIEDGMKAISPLFNTNIEVENTSLNESWISLSSNMTKRKEDQDSEWYYGNYYDAVYGWTNELSFTKTGNYSVKVKRSKDNKTIFTKDFILSGCDYQTEKGNPKNAISSSFDLNTLNFTMLYKRQDIQKYQILTSDFFDFNVYYKDENQTVTPWYDRNDYEMSEMGSIALKSLIDKKYPIEKLNVKLYKWNSTSNSYEAVQSTVSAMVSQPKFALKMLPPSGTIILSSFFDSKKLNDQVKMDGLYRVDLSRSFTDIGLLSSETFDTYELENQNNMSETQKECLRTIDKLSVKSLVENYIAPALSADYDKDDLINSLISGLTNQNLIDGLWIDEVTGSVKTQFTNYLKKSLRENSDGFIDDDTPMSAFTGTMNDLLANHINSQGEIDMSSLSLKNPNDIPIRYCSLVVKDLILYFRAKIRLGEGRNEDGTYQRTISYNPAYRNFVFKLKIFNDDNEVVQTLYNVTIDTYIHNQYIHCFEIMGLHDGWYTFKVYHLNDIEIYNRRFYIWNGHDIDIVIDESCFIPNVISGAITWNGAAPINNVHIRVDNLDHNEVYYGNQFNGYSYDYRYYRNIDMHYHQNSFNEDTSNDLDDELPRSDEGNTNENGGGRRCYGEGFQRHALGQYRLYDLIPGTYRLSYYVMPDLAATDYDNSLQWKIYGDSYYYYNVFDSSINIDASDDAMGDDVEYSPNSCSFTKLNINEMLNTTKTINVPISSIQWHRGTKILRDEYASYQDWDVMEVLLYFNLSYDMFDGNYGTTDKTLSSSYTSQYALHKKSLMFTSVREGDYFKITLMNDSDFFNFGADSSTLKGMSPHSIRILFGEKVGEQTINVTNSTKTAPTIDISRMYARSISLIGENYDNVSYRIYRDIIMRLNDAKLSNTVQSINKRNGYNTNECSVTFYGVEAGKKYDVSFGIQLTNEFKTLVSDELTISATTLSKTLTAPTLNEMTLIVKDKAVYSNGLPGYIRRSMNAWLFFDDSAPSAYQKMTYNPEYGSSSFGQLNFKWMFNDYYSVGAYIDNLVYYYGDIEDLIENTPNDRKEWKYYVFNTTSLTSGLVQHELIDTSKTLVKYVPYQNLKVSINGWNIKNNSSESPSMKLKMVRSQQTIDATDSMDKTYSASNGTLVRSGYYSEVSYVTNYANSTDTFEVRYESLVMDNDRTFTLYSNISVNQVKIRLTNNGTPCANEKLFLYDKNKNLFKTLTTNATGYVVDNLPYFPFYLKGISKSNGFSNASKSFETSKTYVFDATTLTITE